MDGLPKYTGNRVNYLIGRYGHEIADSAKNGDRAAKDLCVAIEYFNGSQNANTYTLICHLLHDWLRRNHPESVPMARDSLVYDEVYQDLFLVGDKYVLAHCIGADAGMGAGIAKTFVARYPGIREYCRHQYPKVGQVIKFGRVYNLATKRFSFQKPKYDNLYKALMSLKGLMSASSENFLAMPQIGCGSDRLDWKIVSPMIKDVFSDTDFNIIICKKEDSKKFCLR